MATPTLGDIIQAVGSPAEWAAVGVGSSLFSGYLNASVTGLNTSGATYSISLTEYFDIGNNFSTDTYTAPVNGYYQVDFSVHCFPVGGNIIDIIAAVLNSAGTWLTRGTRVNFTTGGYCGVNGSKLLYLAAGATVKLGLYYSISAGTLTIEGGGADITFITIQLVSKAN